MEARLGGPYHALWRSKASSRAFVSHDRHPSQFWSSHPRLQKQEYPQASIKLKTLLFIFKNLRFFDKRTEPKTSIKICLKKQANSYNFTFLPSFLPSFSKASNQPLLPTRFAPGWGFVRKTGISFHFCPNKPNSV
jgi:hypothetical protein